MSNHGGETNGDSADRWLVRRVPWKLLILIALVLFGLASARFYDVPQSVTDAMNWIDAQGAVGAIVFVVLYVAATVLVFPASILTLGAGAVYGLAVGFVLVSLSSTLGATAAFLVSRYAARDWVTRRMASHPKFRALDDGVAENGWKIVFLTRLSPVFPFNMQNYGYGLTKIPLLHYVVASWIGMIPGTLMYVYLGHAAGSVAEASAGSIEKSPARWALFAIGLLATVAVTILITRIATRKLEQSGRTSEA